jgi:cytochrome c biogenesis protein CcdA/thiol-disulfide isomerase/thioredoxin
VILLVIIGFLGGIVTGISPCVLPVLPVVFASGAASGLPDEPEDTPAGPPPAAGDESAARSTADGRAASVVTEQAMAVSTVRPPVGSVVPTPIPELATETEDTGPIGASTALPLEPTAALGQATGPPDARWEPSGGATRRRRGGRDRRSISVVAGLVLTFGASTLFGTWLLSALGLPLDYLTKLGLVVLGVVGLGLLVPPVGELLEYPFVKLARGRPLTEGGGFVLGASLGLVFVPCAGPVLGAISAVGATHRIGWSAVVLTLAFCAGIAVPLLVFAVLGERLAERVPTWRTRAGTVRQVIGALLILAAVVIGANWTAGLQQLVPGYTNRLQTAIEGGTSAKRALAGVKGQQVSGSIAMCNPMSPVLQRCGKAPAIRGIDHWLNTPGDRPVSLGSLHGRVVLVDFWTYSCINCQRTLPHVEAWYRAYAGAGFTVIGVHTPEFAFEHVLSNVRTSAAQLGVHYPVALDNQYATWNAYENSYWPAEYLIDASGTIRHVDFGEGDYGQTETFIRSLLTAADPSVVLPSRTDVPDATPTEQTTPESYLGDQHPENLADQTIVPDQLTTYQAPSSVPSDEYAYGGQWSIGTQASTAGANATLELNFSASDVYLVLGGQGTVQVRVNGRPTTSVAVAGVPRLYQLVGPGPYQQSLLSLSFTPGVQAYDFTFG